MRLITGATGFIGRRVLRNGDRALVRGVCAYANSIRGDLLDQASLLPACEGVETVIHCAGYAHAFADSSENLHRLINFEGTRNLLRAARSAGVRRFVFLSSIKAMSDPGDVCADEDYPGEPSTPYGRAKREAECAVMSAGAESGMHVTVLRLAMVYGQGGRGNLERMARAIQAGWFPPIPETGNRRSIIHVDDVVSAVEAVSVNPAASGRTFIVSDPVSYSGRMLYDGIRKSLGKRPIKHEIPESLIRFLGRAGDRVASISGTPFRINSEIVSRLLDSACYSSARIRRELGWSAEISLEAGLRGMLG